MKSYIDGTPESRKALNDLARHQTIVRLLADIRMDMMVCEIEGWDRLEYINILKAELNRKGKDMSILIKGMKMPKACCECGFNHCSQSRDDDTCLLLDKGISQLFVLVDRLPDCPLVEVPPHGRLIDCETLKDDLAVLLERNEKLIDEWLAYAIDDVIDDAPTIIEAEGGEEDDEHTD